MPRRDLTDRFCANVRTTDLQTDFFDAGTPGLALRVTQNGTKSWTWIFTWAGKRTRMTFGTYPATSLARARTLADEARGELEQGRDPRALLAKPETLRAVCDDWGSREAASLRTGAVQRATLTRLVYPTLGALRVTELRRSDIVRLLDHVEDEHGAPMADKVLAILRRVLNWYASRSDDYRSPIVRGMARTKPEDRKRRRILTDDELRIIWSVAGEAGAFGRLVRFLLLTAARRTEAAGMSWAELAGAMPGAEGGAVDWTLPAARNKTQLDLVRPLPPAALAQLGERTGAAFPFSNDGGSTPLRGYTALKEAFDLRLGSAVADWRLHDLRRTARSLMSRAGVASDHAEHVLGHVIPGVRGIYDRHEYHDEKATALAALARIISDIVTGTAPNVVRLRHG